MQEVVWALLLLSCELCCFTSGSVVSLPVFGLPSFAELPCGFHLVVSTSYPFYVILWRMIFGGSFPLVF